MKGYIRSWFSIKTNFQKIPKTQYTYLNNKQLAIIKGKLIIDGTPAIDLIQKYRTPFFVFIEQRIRDNCQTILNLSKKYFNSQIYYSYKANYLTPICKIIAEEGLGAEIATEYEYDIAIQNNINPKSIILSSPYKPASLLKKLITNGIGLIFICQIDEISEIAKYVEDEQVIDIGIRLRSPRPNKQIGISLDQNITHDIIENLNKTKEFSLTTLQLHSGTQIDDQLFKEGINYLLNIANQFESHGITVSQLDFGGGFPEASSLSEEELENRFLLLFETLNDRGWQKVICIFEPGRYIVADAGLLLTQIIQVFNVENTPWIMLNTGTHHCPKFSNSKFRFELINRMSAPRNTSTSIAGCLPTDMDVFTKRYPFPDNVKKGDYLAILNAGAYTFTWSTHFSYPYPPIILLNKDQIIPIKIPQVL
ncbi:MAG: diaminopimelate decarboxylase family protein [Promethearchaeota archaeon]